MAKQKNTKVHYTITSRYLYLHDKKKIKKSNHVWRTDISRREPMQYSCDGGNSYHLFHMTFLEFISIQAKYTGV